MAFGNCKEPGEAALAYNLSFQVASFMQQLACPVDERFQSDLTFFQHNSAMHMSDAAADEFLIAPVLFQVWRPHCDALLLWSHVPLQRGASMLEPPDYYFAMRGPLGLVRDQAYILVMQARKDDFEGGWGQCLAAMFAAHRMLDRPRAVIYGSVTNGLYWEFGKLDGRSFTQEMRQWVLSDLDELFAAWNYLFAQAKEQALAPAA